jgi:shikimate kinase
MECLKELGTSIYLKWNPKDLARRLTFTNLDERPILQGRSEEELLAFITPQLEARIPFYEQADYIIQAPLIDLPEEDDKNIADIIYKLLHNS